MGEVAECVVGGFADALQRRVRAQQLCSALAFDKWSYENTASEKGGKKEIKYLF
jgi:hypothetical protein